MSPEVGGHRGGRVHKNFEQGWVPPPGELQIHESLTRSDPPETAPRVRYNMDPSREMPAPGPTPEELAERRNLLSSPQNYYLTERAGRVFATIGDQEADVTDMFEAGAKIDRYHAASPEGEDPKYTLTESVTVHSLSRVTSGENAGQLRVNTIRPNGRRQTIGLDEIGYADHEKRRWRFPVPEEGA